MYESEAMVLKLKKTSPVSGSGNSKRPTRLGEIITDSLPTLAIWNLLFLLTCIPLFTIGPAMAAMAFCTNALIIDDRPQKGSVRLFFHAFRASFFKSLPIGLFFLLVSTIFGGGFFVYTYLSSENMVYIAMSSVSLLVLTFSWGLLTHLFPLLFDFEKTDWDSKCPVITKKGIRVLIREASRHGMIRMIQTLLALIFSVLFLGSLVLFLPATVPLLITVGFSFAAIALAAAHTKSPY